MKLLWSVLYRTLDPETREITTQFEVVEAETEAEARELATQLGCVFLGLYGDPLTTIQGPLL